MLETKMPPDESEDFYRLYGEFKSYERRRLHAKHVRWYDAEFWTPTGCDVSMSVLEVGCGAGHFLSYLKLKGVGRFVGVDQDPQVVDFLEPGLEGHVRIADVRDFLAGEGGGFDRIVMLDVLEHFSAAEAVKLLRALKENLAEGGLLNVRVPNSASPWGLQHQYGDLTHKTAYTPDSLRQLALAAGYEMIAFLPQRRGSPFRRVAEDLLHGFLSRVLTETPPLWSANMIAVLKPQGR